MALVNNFVIKCEWTPEVDVSCTLLETGNVKLSYATNVITFAKGAFSAAAPYTFVADVAVELSGRLSSAEGVDVWVDDVKGTGNADVSDSIPAANLQIGNSAALDAAINSTTRNVNVINGDLTDEQVEAL